jgi:hypothetical protein
MKTQLRLLALLAILGGAPTLVHATSLVSLSTDQMTDASELVVRGVVERVSVEVTTAGRIATRAEVRVVDGYKGNVEEGDYVDVLVMGGVLPNGEIMDVPSSPRFSEGEETLLFLSAHRDGETYGVVGMSHGKFTVKQDPADGRPMLVRFTLPYTENFDARFVPNPSKDKRVKLDDLAAQVEARVDLGWDGKPIPGISDARLRLINRLQPGVK